MLYGKTFFLAAGRTHEIDQSQTLAIGIGVDYAFIGSNRRRRNRAGSVANLRAQIWSSEVLANAFKRKKVKGLVLLDWSTNCSTKLFTMKVSERTSIRCVGCESLQPLDMHGASMY